MAAFASTCVLLMLPAFSVAFRMKDKLRINRTSIVDGKDAQECAWPHHVRIEPIWCGGTLIHPEWVLTAAHCVVQEGSCSMRDMTFKIIAGDLDTSKSSGNEQTRGAAEVIFHPQFGCPNNYAYDLALIRLDRPVTLGKCVGIANLPKAEVAPGSDCWISGWGLNKPISQGVSIPKKLQEAELTSMSQQSCRRYWGSSGSEEMICVDGKTKASTSVGDSGGGLVCRSDESWTVYGALAFGPPDGVKKPTVFASAHHELQWIYDQGVPRA